MFCKNCGKEITAGTKFCSNCGSAAEGGSVNAAVNAETKNNPADSNKKMIGIIAVAAVFLVAFLIGKFAVAPSMTDNDSSKEAGGGSSYTQNDYSYSNDSGSAQDSYSNDSGYAQSGYESSTTKIRMYRADTGTVSSTISLMYKGDTVLSINGYIGFYNLDSSDVYSLKQEYTGAQSDINSLGTSNISLDVNSTDYSVSVTFSFKNLDRESKTVVQTAAEFLGISQNNGVISMSTAEREILKYGYTFQEEY